jgi:hypothetical protein
MTMKYLNGIEVQAGDKISVQHQDSTQPAVIIKVISPGTQDATDWDLPEGGVIIEGGGYGLFTMPQLDEDIEFVHRELMS